jgi:hypothetical protein
MIRHQDWNRLSDDEKFDALRQYAEAAEHEVGRLWTASQGLLDWILKLEKGAADNI